MPSDSLTKWDIIGQTVPLPPTPEGHFAALEFSLASVHDGSITSPQLNGFVVVVKVISQNGGVMRLAGRPRSPDDSLLRVFKDNFQEARFIRGTFRHGDGELHMSLQRMMIFDQDAFVLDIDNTKEVATEDVPDISLDGPDN